ncbi:gustatory and pheromone receptor 39a-like isoform X1 [Bactrocera tryoni]|uniref:gustatory and pheromone receptor 39a-like isoform X1 n=1 Tax=Bactrocera tryoni TaxID=59916 RepID=UPI001A977A8F|nr:gustatory and pheromone receptor 39a-like isoform X1 [Bactrocera tryoni]
MYTVLIMPVLNIVRVLRFYTILLRCLGIIPIGYCQKENKYVLQTGWKFQLMHWNLQCIYTLSMAILITRRESFFSTKNNYIENNYWNLLVFGAMLVQLLINAWIFTLRRFHLHILNYCIHLTEELSGIATRKVGLYQLVMMVAVMGASALNTFFLWNRFSVPSTFRETCLHIPWLIFQIYFFILSFILSIYICIVQIIAGHLITLNTFITMITFQRRLRITDIYLDNIQNCLEIYDNILFICTEYISKSYGVIFVLITFISTLDITFIVYGMYTGLMEGYLEKIYCIAQSVSFALPSVIFLCMMLLGSNIPGQANETVKILAKIPHTGTGLDKMVDKFLMKNIRKKPILTAYGFFQLDRSALFKLLTAIITYIMILVQFTDIENSLKTKQIQTNKN